jgi:hypothetical protein
VSLSGMYWAFWPYVISVAVNDKVGASFSCQCIFACWGNPSRHLSPQSCCLPYWFGLGGTVTGPRGDG